MMKILRHSAAKADHVLNALAKSPDFLRYGDACLREGMTSSNFTTINRTEVNN